MSADLELGWYFDGPFPYLPERPVGEEPFFPRCGECGNPITVGDFVVESCGDLIHEECT